MSSYGDTNQPTYDSVPHYPENTPALTATRNDVGPSRTDMDYRRQKFHEIRQELRERIESQEATQSSRNANERIVVGRVVPNKNTTIPLGNTRTELRGTTYAEDSEPRYRRDNANLRTEIPVEVKEPERTQVESILTKAQGIVHGARQHDYGHPAINHERTADLYRAYFRGKFGVDLPISNQDVCWLNILQKTSREMNRETEDGILDVAGYAANIEMIREANSGH